jgi:O-glycosyl hydrolase
MDLRRSPLPRLLVLAAGVATLTGTPGFSAEQATYNSAGALTSLIHDGVELPVHGEFVVAFVGGTRAGLQPHDQKSPIRRDGTALHWRGDSTFQNATQARFEAGWAESDDGVTFSGTAFAGGPPAAGAGDEAHRPPLDTTAVEYVLDVPRAPFAGGQLSPAGATLPGTQPAHPTFYQGNTDRLVFTDAAQNWTLTLSLDHPRPVSVTDVWDSTGRAYRVGISLHRGPWSQGDAQALRFTLALAGHAAASEAHVVVDAKRRLYAFDGFGGDYCFGTDSPATAYTLDHLEIAWARCEFKAGAWDRERAAPGAELQADFRLMQRLQQKHVPWVLSLWRLPERYYSDPNQQPPGTFNRHIAMDRWPEFLDLLGSYLTYLKQHYGAEPDLFSFNEPDLGVDLGFTPAAHRDTIKKLGAEFQRLGLKTKLLLGDTANPRDTHTYVLATAADPDAMRYVGALSFHSWGNGSAGQYAAWGDVAAWLHRPLLVGEAGVDPSAWRNSAYDSYAYGLREARQYQELLAAARPTALLYWEFTDDYGLVRVGKDGKVEPTGRFWLMKQFNNLTPQHSEAIAVDCDQADVLVSGFVRGAALALHVLNTGPARRIVLTGVPAGAYRRVVTEEEHGYRDAGALPLDNGGRVTLELPARSLTTMVGGEAAR